MKRYDIHFNYGDPVMVERPTGEYYSRADLIASGCLVPVPDGDAGGYWNCERCAGMGDWFDPTERKQVTCPVCKGQGRVRLVRLEKK